MQRTDRRVQDSVVLRMRAGWNKFKELSETCVEKAKNERHSL